MEATFQNSATEGATRLAEANKKYFLNTFAAVPDDKLTYTPSPTAKNALKIAAHVAATLPGLAMIIGRQPMPDMTAPELFAFLDAEADKLHTREKVVEAIEAGHAQVLAALAALTPEDTEATVVTPLGEGSMGFYMNLPGVHYMSHGAQIDYLQTCWGDLDLHYV
jgi:hypothetical protein